MIPLFIPYVNRPDLLDRAIASVPNEGVQLFVINNSDNGLRSATLTPPVPLTFAQTQNWMLKVASGPMVPFYLFLHSDAECQPSVITRLIEMAEKLEREEMKWGCIFTSYDALCAFNTKAMLAIGGWDTLLSWYACDCDAYYRLRLAGYPTIESHLPVSHTPSQTLKSDARVASRVNLEMPFRQSYYQEKWGGQPGNERYLVPFNRPVAQ